MAMPQSTRLARDEAAARRAFSMALLAFATAAEAEPPDAKVDEELFIVPPADNCNSLPAYSRVMIRAQHSKAFVSWGSCVLFGLVVSILKIAKGKGKRLK